MKRHSRLLAGRRVMTPFSSTDAPKHQRMAPDARGALGPLRRRCVPPVHTLVHLLLARSALLFALLPLQWVMDPVDGAIVNRCGHKCGHESFATDDESRNTIPFGSLTWGELFQNNHHRFPMAPNLAARSFELDPAFRGVQVLARLGIVHYPLTVQRGRLHDRPGSSCRSALPRKGTPRLDASGRRLIALHATSCCLIVILGKGQASPRASVSASAISRSSAAAASARSAAVPLSDRRYST